MSKLLRRVMRTPLLAKLVVFDLGINLFALVVMEVAPPLFAEQVMLLCLVGVLILNAALVAWALLPLKVLEGTARRVSQGELDARAIMPPMADRNLVRIGDALNTLLDSLTAERTRVRSLAAKVVAEGDLERARIARELHDGTAQSLSAVDILLSAALSETSVEGMQERLHIVQAIVSDALSEVRGLAQGLHPRVLDDLGLTAAIEQLARHARAGGSQVTVSSSVQVPPSQVVASVLYRVVQEALANAVKHSHATAIHVDVAADAASARVRVTDDGCGFHRDQVAQQSDGMGLFAMNERVLLVDGSFDIRTQPGAGTQVSARIPTPETP